MRAGLFWVTTGLLTGCECGAFTECDFLARDHDEQTGDSGTSSLADDTGDSGDPTEPVPTSVQATPAALDLGLLDPRCPIELDVQLTTSGDAAAGAITVAAPEGWAVSDAPTALEVGQTATLTLSWDGTRSDPSGALTVDFAQADRLTVAILATPQLPTEHLTIDLSPRKEADLLLAVDRSCNMDDMAGLEPHWPTLRHRLREAGIALRMASVVEDDACVLGEPVVLDDRLDDGAFRAALWTQQNWLGDWGRYTEKLLDLSSRALTASCNAELVQGSAPLHVLAFSDEPDQSDEDWTVYIERMQELPDPGVPLTVHGIGGGVSSGCDAMHYAGVLQATEATRGVFLDICTDDWESALTDLADGMAQASRRVVMGTFTEHDGEPVAVRQAGVVLTDWSWDGGQLTLPEDVDLTGEVNVELMGPAVCE